MASEGLPSMYGSNAGTVAAAEDQDAGLDVWGFLQTQKIIRHHTRNARSRHWLYAVSIAKIQSIDPLLWCR